MRLVFLGDIMLGRGTNEVMDARPPEWLWGDTLELLGDADLVVGNLECAISDRGSPWDETPKVFHFRASPKAVDVLRAGGVDAVSLANNHILDYGYEAFGDTLDHLDRAGIVRAGAGRDLDEARRPVRLDGVSLVAWTDNEPPFAAAPDRGGTNRFDVGADELERQIAAARELSPRVIVSAHWGPNMVVRPPGHHREYARRAVEAGCGIWHGHSAHIPQGAQWIRGPGGWSIVLYDTGDVIDDYAIDDELRNDLSLLFVVEADAGDAGWDVHRVDAHPLKLDFGRVSLATGADHDRIADRFVALCAELGTDARRSDDRVVLTPG